MKYLIYELTEDNKKPIGNITHLNAIAEYQNDKNAINGAKRMIRGKESSDFPVNNDVVIRRLYNNSFVGIIK